MKHLNKKDVNKSILSDYNTCKVKKVVRSNIPIYYGTSSSSYHYVEFDIVLSENSAISWNPYKQSYPTTITKHINDD